MVSASAALPSRDCRLWSGLVRESDSAGGGLPPGPFLVRTPHKNVNTGQTLPLLTLLSHWGAPETMDK
ncbi:hypothetical protein CH63R_00916 [Colletotrichum higginsianum IMI 349063]|uniref:Uncharacterized protein n=1 Tax=Colletotrichum higginsianum (strain IMI 349063) TaxID=759273 RepID=A0A1B7YUK4_COLHI|nr:hypothetical protein CH63R_00916 [Colletotrichum higginsianum IMI 349063]OBR15736.1 hypothetical protein CH63R_00916 [Colletotrichum higginsianum IMI 349063]GJC91988.1 hypothetical protein ColKHC_00814 [Colletotrichum higginsianum]